MKLPFLNGVVTRAGVHASIAALAFTLVATGCSGGGSGGGAGLPTPPDVPVIPDFPTDDAHGDSPFDATVVKPGQEITTGFFNILPGGEVDKDFFVFNVVSGQWYGLQNWAHENGNYNLAAGAERGYLWSLFDSTGSTVVENSSDWDFPPGLELDDGLAGFRIMWQAEYTGKYFFSIRSFRDNTIGAYAFKLATTNRALSVPLRGTTNKRSYVEIYDPDSGNLRFIGPAFSGAQAASTFLSGSTDVGPFSLPVFGEFELATSVSSSVVFFLDDEGVPNDDPETRAWHFHVGIPSGDLGDGIDDIVWQNGTVPVDNYFRNANFQTGSPHEFVFATDFGEDGPDLTPALAHMIIGLQWYIDVHITNNLEIYPEPIVSSLPQGGVNMFDSIFVLNGFDTSTIYEFPLKGSFPVGTGTGSFRTLEVVYDDEFQVFYLPYGNQRDHAALEGSTLHLHTNVNSTNGPLLFNFGVIPPVVTRPVFEGFQTATPLISETVYTLDNVPGIENVIHFLTDEEAVLLNDATYAAGGWYLDLHTDQGSPELRDNAVLGGNLEVGLQRAP